MKRRVHRVQRDKVYRTPLTTEVQIGRICEKAPHATNDAARAELAGILLRGGARLEEMNLYQCSICGGAWHVGHRVPSQERVPVRPARRRPHRPNQT